MVPVFKGLTGKVKIWGMFLGKFMQSKTQLLANPSSREPSVNLY